MPAVDPARDGGASAGFVLGASFIVGAVTVVVEILGTRVVSPYYGTTIYVWSSLIGVTLASLAAGYSVGGWTADRWPHRRVLAGEMVGGGLWLLCVPWMRHVVLSSTTGLGLRMGSLASAAILFAPALVLLSMTGPVAIRLLTTRLTFVGRGVGTVYGFSTAGSLLGAILTGFVLIPSFSVSSVLSVAAVVLFATGAAGLGVPVRARSEAP